MSRSKKRIDRNIHCDPKYGSAIIAKFINVIMKDGKKEVSEKIVYKALAIFEEKTKCKPEDTPKRFSELIKDVGPEVDTKARRVGGSTYQVPFEVKDGDRISKGMRILMKVLREKKGIAADKALAQEILDISEKKGKAYKEKEAIQKMALANKAYAHLA